MLWVGESIVSLGRCKTYEEIEAQVQKVTPQDIQRVAGQIFKAPGLHLAVVGSPKASESELLDKLHFYQ